MSSKLIKFSSIILLILVISISAIAAKSEKEKVIDYYYDFMSFLKNPETMSQARKLASKSRTKKEVSEQWRAYCISNELKFAKKNGFDSKEQLDSLMLIYESDKEFKPIWDSLGYILPTVHKNIEKIQSELELK